MWPFGNKKLREALAIAIKSAEVSRDNAAKLEELNLSYQNMFREQGDLIDSLIAANEVERMRLVACGVGAMANTREAAFKQRVDKDNPYHCASVQDVYDAVDREMALREKVETYEKALRELSCLGNGERPGNSNGNMIAIRALEVHCSTKNCVKCGSEMIPMHDTDKKLCSNGACGHEVEWKLEEGQSYQYKRDVEPFVEDRSNAQDELEPPRSSLERL